MIPAALLGTALAQDPPPADAAKVVHGTEVRVKHREYPTYPEAAKQLGIEEALCKVRFSIDEQGTPTDIQILECPKVFEQATLDAAWKWRFYPLEVEGVPTKCSFVLNVKYVLGDDPEDDFGPVGALNLGAGARGGGAGGAVRFSLSAGARDHLYRSVQAIALLGPRHEGQPVSFWREDLVLGPQVWMGATRLALYTGLGLDRWGGVSSLRLPVGATALVRFNDPLMLQVSGQPSLVLAGTDDRRKPGIIDELAVEAGLWIAAWADSDGYRGGVHLSGGWLDQAERDVIYASVGAGMMPAR